MKKLFIAFAALFTTVGVWAQEEATSNQPVPVFGYFSYSEAIQAMPEYKEALDSVARFQQACDKEMARVEKDFNQKYEAFLDGQKDFPRTILLKRQQELQQMMEQNIAFRKQLQEEVKKTEAGLMQPIREKLQQQLSEVGAQHHLLFILNTDNDQLPWLDTQRGVNVQELLKSEAEN